MLIDEPQILLKDLEPSVFLSETVMSYAMLGQPLVVDVPHLGIGSPAGLRSVVVVVGDYGHVGGGR